jgi:hypothetical protein
MKKSRLLQLLLKMEIPSFEKGLRPASDLFADVTSETTAKMRNIVMMLAREMLEQRYGTEEMRNLGDELLHGFLAQSVKDIGNLGNDIAVKLLDLRKRIEVLERAKTKKRKLRSKELV